MPCINDDSNMSKLTELIESTVPAPKAVVAAAATVSYKKTQLCYVKFDFFAQFSCKSNDSMKYLRMRCLKLKVSRSQCYGFIDRRHYFRNLRIMYAPYTISSHENFSFVQLCNDIWQTTDVRMRKWEFSLQWQMTLRELTIDLNLNKIKIIMVFFLWNFFHMILEISVKAFDLCAHKCWKRLIIQNYSAE